MFYRTLEMSRNMGGKQRTECLNNIFPLSALLCEIQWNSTKYLKQSKFSIPHTCNMGIIILLVHYHLYIYLDVSGNEKKFHLLKLLDLILCMYLTFLKLNISI